MRAFDAALSTPWAMLPENLETLLSISARENEISPETLEAYRSSAVTKAETLEQRDGVAILNMIGPLFRRANLFTAMSGATSYDILRRDLQVALEDPSLTAILLNIDSPGGDANGCDELAKAIVAARAVKPVIAYVGGTAASGGYWLACAASEIVVADTAMLGSIGVIISLRDTRARDEAAGVKTYDFISSQSPHKRSDPSTRKGEDQFQRVADDLADVFIGAVASNRGISAERVISDFGGGGLLIGAKAVKAGLADRTGTFEDTLAKLQQGGRSPGRPTQRSMKGKIMSENKGPIAGGEDFDAVKAENDRLRTELAAKETATKTRIKSIMTSTEAKGREAQAEYLAYETDMTAEAAIAILGKAPVPTAPAASEEPEPRPDAAEYEAQRALAAGIKDGKPPPPRPPLASISLPR